MTTALDVISDSNIQIGKFKLAKTGLVVSGSPSFEEWQACGEFLTQAEKAIQFWIGDWLNYGERRYGETYAQAIDDTGLDYQTLKKAKWVASNVELVRRRTNLSFSHHEEVAALPPGEQDKLLEKADENGWTRERMRREVSSHKREQAALAANGGALPDDVILIHGDFVDVCANLPAASVDVVMTDPPYPREFIPLYGKLAETSARLLKPGGSLLVMVGQSYLPDVLALMTPHLRYHWTAAYLTPGGQAVQLWDRKVNTFWKPVLWLVKGDYERDWIGDVSKSDANDKQYHDWGQSESGMADLVRRFTRPGDTVLDPFLGGGTTGVVCHRMHRRFIGIDIEESNVRLARGRIQANGRTR